MTVFDNMAFALKMRHIPKEDIKRIVYGAAKLLGIESLLKENQVSFPVKDSVLPLEEP